MPATRRKTTDAAATPHNLIGRDEMNLSEFPIALADRAQTELKTLYFDKEQGRLTVTGSDAYGLPTSEDTDVIVALIYLTKLRNDFSDVKVNFSRYEIIKLLRWNEGGDSYKRLEESFKRWMGVMLVFDKCWWNNKKNKYVHAQMHILEEVFLADADERKRSRQADLPLSTFKWNQTFIESCQADNLRLLDLTTYFSLKSAVSKRLYRFLGKRFYYRDDLTFDLKEIAFDRVGLSRSYQGNAGKIKAKLQAAIDELESIGFLRPMSREERYHRIDRGQWTIRLAKPSPALAVASAPNATAASSPSLADELTRRGVSAKSAKDLVTRHQAEAIAGKIEVFDWLVAKQDARVEKSPAGYLVASINDDYAQPKGFEPAADRAARMEAKRQADEQKAQKARRERDQHAAERAEQQRIGDYWKSLTSEEQAQLQEAADHQANPADLAAETVDFKSFGQLIRRNGYIRQLLLNRQPEDA